MKRTRGGWEWVAIALIVCQFFLPFFLLLIRENKRRYPSRSLGVCLLILVMHWIDLIWLVIPASIRRGEPADSVDRDSLERTGFGRRRWDLDCRFRGAIEEVAAGAAQ